MLASRRVVLFFPFHFIAESWNGLDEHIRLLCAHLDRDRYDLIVAEHPGDGPQTRSLAQRAGIPLAAVGPRHAPPLARLRELRQLLRRRRVDILHLHSPTAGGQLIPALAARSTGARTLATYHQIQPDLLPRPRRALNGLVHGLLVDRTVAVSGDVRRTLIRNAGLSDAIAVRPNGIDPDPPSVPAGPDPRGDPEEVLIGAFARLSPEKGLPGVLEAMRIVAREHPRARLIVTGDGPERAALTELAARLDLTDRVDFLGFRPDARRLMSRMDIVVHAPVYEGFGLVVLEAMAAGVPVVAVRAAGAIGEIVLDGQTGILVEPGDPRALATAIGTLVRDPAARRRLGAAGRARCEEHFSAQSVARQTAALYEELVRGRERVS